MQQINQLKDFKKLDDYTKIYIAARNEEVLSDDNRAFILKKEFAKEYINIFGKTVNYKLIADYKKGMENFTDETIYRRNDGKLAVMAGYWGTAYPVYSINKIYKKSKNTYLVKCTNYFLEDDINKKTKIGETTYTIKKDTNAKYKYIVTDAFLSCKKKKYNKYL